MRDKLTKSFAISVVLLMLVSCVAPGIAGYTIGDLSFDDSLPAGNLTTVPYYRMPIDGAGHFSSCAFIDS